MRDSTACPRFSAMGRIAGVNVQNSVPGVTAVMMEGSPYVYWYNGYLAGFMPGDRVAYTYMDCGEKRLLTLRRV
jgi:hypothetical protein